jgi:hypothetical protein
MHLVALVGFKGSGKDTAGRHLVEKHGFNNFSFAESLKDALASIFCWDRAMLEGDTAESRAWRETVDAWWADKLGIPDFTPRMAMQNVGTNLFRQHFHKDIWIHNIERKLTLLPQDGKVVLIDGRFPNELGLGRKFGGTVVRVKRGPEPEWFETALIANGHGPGVDPEKAALARAMMEGVFHVHESEWAWIGAPIDHTIENDGTIDDLHQRMQSLVILS